MNRKSVAGILLIAVGVMAALVNLGVFSGSLFLPTVSLGLLTMYVLFGGRGRDSNLGFLIPGTIVGAISIFTVLNERGRFGADGGGAFLMMLGGAFLTILVVHTMHGQDRDWGARFWPIFPAGGLILTGAAATARMNLPFTVWNMLGPAALIVVGLSLWYRNRGQKED